MKYRKYDNVAPNQFQFVFRSRQLSRKVMNDVFVAAAVVVVV